MKVTCELVGCIYCVDHTCKLSKIKIDEYGGCLSAFVIIEDINKKTDA